MTRQRHELLPADRSRPITQAPLGDGPVVYWMSRDQRVQDNWALLHAQRLALQGNKGLAVVFCLTLSYPSANLRHYSFLLAGLQEVTAECAELGIPFFLLTGKSEPPDALLPFLRECNAGLLVCDFDPLRLKRAWQHRVAAEFPCRIDEVDAHNLIPCWLASDKQEYSAATFRPKVRKLLAHYLTEFPDLIRHPVPFPRSLPPAIDWQALHAAIPDRSVGPASWLHPGATAARLLAEKFVGQRLHDYADSHSRNDPNLNGQSGLSPYLHFGQISAQRIALAVLASDAPPESKDAFLEELVVRRELADNFCHHNPHYDSVQGFPAWAHRTLDAHRPDRREYLYDIARLEGADTHDPLWNAAQKELVLRGKLHGYLRMYWAKKLLEWTDSPETALHSTLQLNDRYQLDGRDPNGFTGAAWSIGGVHDRPWPERPVFGKIRYMNARGCARKFDVARYIRGIEAL